MLATALLIVSPPLQPAKGLVFPVLGTRTAVPDMRFEPLTPREGLHAISLFPESPPWGTGLDLIIYLPFLHDSMGIFFSAFIILESFH